MPKTFALFFVMLCTLTLPHSARAGQTITRVSDRQTVTLQQVITKAEAADLVLIGEVHDATRHHDLQLEVIRELRARKLPLAIGVEVMQSDCQKELDAFIAGTMSEAEFRPVFARNWSYDWSLYRDIFMFARENRIPMIGLNVPKELVIKVSRSGYASLTPEERKNLPEGTSCDLNNPHTDFLKQSFGEIFKHNAKGRVFQYFCEAQTLRNSGMAMSVSRYLKRAPKTKIVVLAGVWHAVKNAIPEQLARDGAKLSTLVVMPEIKEFSDGKASPDFVDYLASFPSP
ncbi:ChaN family lipoprotein [Geomonas subterranea]|uniref:ChaN family lipoprotein n=2 Tax=Geomonas subterranea TaxID=2847989 RepID=A0ABX8LLU1_9BACT|nr:ChaN family lipoprotein [Geomonas subterranea]QXM11586.1 ChaN family lipoprotein [Geomonas subterranea]